MKSLSFYYLAKLSPNPFDIYPPGTSFDGQQNTLWAPILLSSLAFTLLFTFFRPLMIRSLNAITSVNQFKHLTQDIYDKGILDFILPLIVALYTLSIFCSIHFPAWSIFHIFSTLFVGILIKLAAIRIVGALFDFDRASHYHSSTIVILYLALGILLVPINLFVVFSNAAFEEILLNTGIALSSFMFFARYLRAIQVNFNLVSRNKFHFLLYICTLELGPFLIIYKLISNQLTL